MNIKGIGTHNIINLYNKNNNQVAQKSEKVQKTDTIEISKLGRSLNTYSLDETKFDNSAKVAEIKKQVENGTYNIDAKLTAQSIIDTIKGNKI